MNEINSVFSQNLRHLREVRRLSLDNLAQKTGVSKSMLAQIERGEANPTISTVWKIANGLKVPFTELVTQPVQNAEVVDSAAITPLVDDSGHNRNYPLFAFDSDRHFELYYVELDAGSRLVGQPHHEGTEEYVTVFSGMLELAVGGQTLRVGDGCAARFRSDIPHVYHNVSGVLCRISMVIYYPR